MWAAVAVVAAALVLSGCFPRRPPQVQIEIHVHVGSTGEDVPAPGGGSDAESE